jgi:hypothetical protein
MGILTRSIVVALAVLLGAPFAFAQGEEPEPLNVFNGEIPQAERIYFVATDGDNAGAGTKEDPWATLPYAVSQVRRGDVIVMRGGIYHHNQTISIQTPSGFIGELITLTAYPGEVPILDFSSQPPLQNQHGIRLNANFWHVIGITIRNASHNGIRMDGSYNILEQVTAYGNHDTGIHMAGGASNNLIKNSDSFRNFNFDTNRTPRIGNNADGFGAKFNIGPNNRYEGCRSWENSDDGFDFWEAQNTITIDNSWAFGNGDASVFGDPANFEGNGNGFKLGGNNVHTPHVVRRSLAFDNFGASRNAKGFDFNNNRGAMRLEHNTAFNNGRNYWFPSDPPDGSQAVFLNNLSVQTSLHAALPPSAVVAGNSWQVATQVSPDVFLSVDTQLAQGPRQADGSLPHTDFLRPAPGTLPVDAGVAFGQPFYGLAPDIGAYPLVQGELRDPWIALAPSAGLSAARVYDVEAGDLWATGAELSVGARAYADADPVITSVSQGIEVHEWIRTAWATGRKNYLFTVAELEAAENTTLLVAHADAVATKPAWLEAFTQTPERITLEAEGTEHTLSVYRRDIAAGETVVLGRNSVDGASGHPMYLVMLGSTMVVSAGDGPVAAQGLELHPSFPNPFATTTNVSYTLPEAAQVSVRVYDLMGREVAELVDERMPAGTHSLVWAPQGLASGVYHLRLAAGGASETRRVVLVR